MDYPSGSQLIKPPRGVVVLVEWHCLLTKGTYFLEFEELAEVGFPLPSRVLLGEVAENTCLRMRALAE